MHLCICMRACVRVCFGISVDHAAPTDSLVDQNHNWRANPDFFLALLWRQVVEGPSSSSPIRVLQAGRDPVISDNVHRELRTHAFCSSSFSSSSSLVLAIANMGPVAQNVSLNFGGDSVPNQGLREEFILTPNPGLAPPHEARSGLLQSRSVLLNGEAIEAVNGAIPPLLGREVDDGALYEAPPWSVAFVRYTEVHPAACA